MILHIVKTTSTLFPKIKHIAQISVIFFISFASTPQQTTGGEMHR